MKAICMACGGTWDDTNPLDMYACENHAPSPQKENKEKPMSKQTHGPMPGGVKCRNAFCRECGYTGPDPWFEKKLVETLSPDEQLRQFQDGCLTTLTCQMCDEKVGGYMDADDVADTAWENGWRVQSDHILCSYCTDNKR